MDLNLHVLHILLLYGGEWLVTIFKWRTPKFHVLLDRGSWMGPRAGINLLYVPKCVIIQSRPSFYEKSSSSS